MEQAVNTFSKGLQLDTHPIVQGTDVLSDCLNGTLLTMNGNEVVLQNDMGNRRVNNAFLPSGYQPVGMKEYGGIIYVAAYNPITNKSQIGSFPSPQRKVDNEKTLPGKFDFNQFYGQNIEEDSYLGIKVLKSDSFIVPLTRDIEGKEFNLRAGDKFSIYSSDLYGTGENYEKFLYQYVTNYKNTSSLNKKAISPKNKKYTLSVGVINSQNEFVDITKTLCRWDDNNIIPYDSSYSDLYKFNDGYFISQGIKDENLSEDINDRNFIKSRQKAAVNTYSYKLVGPLYLKVQLNHIQSFNYNIIPDINEQGDKSLIIEGYVTYNCPDKCLLNIEQKSNENYQSFEEGQPKFNCFDIIYKGEKLQVSQEQNDINKMKNTQCIYNENTNTYSAKIVKIYRNIQTDENNLFEFTIGVNATIDDPDIYIKGLSEKRTIDFGLFGNGSIKISKWKFYNDLEERTSILNFSIDTFPKRGQAFSNFQLVFKDISLLNTNNTEEIILDIDTSNGQLNFNWDQYGFDNRKIYQTLIKYDIVTEDSIIEKNVILEDIQGNISKQKYEIIFNNPQESDSSIQEEKWISTNQFKCNTYTKKVKQLKHINKDNVWYVTDESREIEEENSYDCGCFRWEATYENNEDIKEVKVKKDYTDNMSTTLTNKEIASYIPNFKINPDLPVNGEMSSNIIDINKNTDKTLKTLKIGSSIETVKSIQYCENLESVIVWPGVHLEGFNCCENLKSIHISEGSTIIRLSACPKLESLSLPDNAITKVRLAEYCESLKVLKIGSIDNNNINSMIGILTGLAFNEQSQFDRRYPSLTDIYLFSPVPPRDLDWSVLKKINWHILERYSDAYNFPANYNVQFITQEEFQQYKKEISSPFSSLNNLEDIEDTEENIEENLGEEYFTISGVTRWFLTTELFNDFYTNNLIQDFCTTQNREFLDKMKINLNLNFKIQNFKDTQPEVFGSLISEDPDNQVRFEVRNTKELFIKDFNINSDINENIPYCSNLSLNLQFDKKYKFNTSQQNVNNLDYIFSFDNGNFFGKIIWSDIKEGIASKQISVSNYFSSLQDVLELYPITMLGYLLYNQSLDKVSAYVENRENIWQQDSNNEVTNSSELANIFNIVPNSQMIIYAPDHVIATEGFTPVWWRTNTNEWAFMSDKVTSENSEGIFSFFKKFFGGNLYFCTKTDQVLYTLNQVINIPYNIEYKLQLFLKCKTPTYIPKYSIGNLQFNYMNNHQEYLINVVLTESEMYRKVLEELEYNIFNYIEKSGIIIDNLGNPLNANSIYYKNNNQLIKCILTNYFEVSPNEGSILKLKTLRDYLFDGQSNAIDELEDIKVFPIKYY